MATARTSPPSRRPSAATVERLCILWLISSLLVVILVIAVTLIGNGQLRRHSERISQQSRAIDGLRDDLSQTRRELADLRAGTSRAGAAPETPLTPVEEHPGSAPLVENQPGKPDPAAQDQILVAPDAPLNDHEIDALLQAALREITDPVNGALGARWELADQAAAEEALRCGLSGSAETIRGGQTLARLASLASLLDRDAPAEIFAARALAAGDLPRAYYEICAAKLLARGEVAEAIVFAKRLAAGFPDDPRTGLLLAEAYRMYEDLAAADVALEGLGDVGDLSLSEKLNLGRLLVVLERWDRLDALLASFGDVPEQANPALNYLRGVAAIQQDRLPEALAILDNLIADQQADGLDALPGGPDDYELRTWRAVALLRARQYQAGREALAHAREHPDRPDAWYWLGMLEMQAGNAEEAVPCFQHALAASQRFAPAWEALGTVALNQGDLPTALQNLTNAVDANPRRGSAHFLLAVIHAKQARPGETAAALATALRLDASLLATARQTEVITRMFSDDELGALGGGE